MSKSLDKLKQIMCKIALVLGIILFALIGKFGIVKNVQNVFATNKEDISEDKLSNPNFYSTSGNYISTTSSWTTITPDDESDNASNYKKGIVNINKIEKTIESDAEETDIVDNKLQDNLWKNYGLFKSPGRTSNLTIDDENTEGVNNYLMINAYNFSGHMGYKSKEFTLNKSSYYKISVSLKTINDTATGYVKSEDDDTLETETRKSDAFASIYIDGISDTEATTSFENINTKNTWQTYNFYINTSSFSDEKNLTIKLYLGSKDTKCQGAVFFNQVKIEEYSEAEYNNNVPAAESLKSNEHLISLNNSYIYDIVDNASFDNNLVDWQTVGSANTGDVFVNIVDTQTAGGYVKGNQKYPNIPENNNSSTSNNSALLLYSNADENNATYYGVKSNKFTIKQYGLYRLSFWAYSDCSNSTVGYATLLDSDKESTKLSMAISNTPTGSSNLTNNWKQYSIYISGNTLRDSNLQLIFSIGKDNDNKASGENYVFFDDVRMQEVTYSQFSSGKSADNTLNLTAVPSTSNLVSNGTFDSIENDSLSTNKPISPASWTITGKTNSVYAGVINTNERIFNNNYSNYTNSTILRNPGKIGDAVTNSNNVLMMGTTSKQQNIKYTTSNTISLSANSYYKFEFDCYTQNFSTDNNNGASVKLLDSNNGEIVAVKDIRTNNEWQHYTYYIATNLNSNKCNIELALSNVDAYAYFDNISITSISSELYNNLIANHTDLNIVDLNKNYFGNSANWTVDTNIEYAYNGFLKSNEFAMSTDGEDIGYVMADTNDVKYGISSTNSITLASESWYKISLYINTKDIAKLVNPDNITEYGAYFTITYGDHIDGHYNINTNADELVKYILYIKPTSETSVKINLGLGTDDNKVIGEAYFTKLEIVKLGSESEMTNDKEANLDAIVKSITTIADTTEDNTDTEETEPYSATPAWLLISSLVTSAAMILAILAYFIKKIKIHPRKKKVDTSYDRRQTLDKQFDAKEKIAYRKELIANLTTELNEIKAQTDAYKEAEKAKLDALQDIADKDTADLRTKLKDLYNQKVEISKVHNKDIAENKMSASKEKDAEYNLQIYEIEKQEKQISIKIKHIERNYNKEMAKYDDLIKRSDTRQEEIRKEIRLIKQEIKDINDSLNAMINKVDTK